MSLTSFVNRPAIREAFKKFGIRERTPAALRNCSILVPDAGGPQGLTGTSFDYLARAHLARKLRGTKIKLHQETSVLDRAIDRLDWRGAGIGDWKRHFAEARAEEASYIGGSGDVGRLADLVQYFAMTDISYRSSYFDPAFRPLSKVGDEILRLLDLFDRIGCLSPQRFCILGPRFVASTSVGGADADLVIDDRLIDLKATMKPAVSLQNLCQLAGYAALQRLGGISFGNSVYETRFAGVELYFARYGQLVQWSLEEVFPNCGFDRFCDVFRAEIKAAEATQTESDHDDPEADSASSNVATTTGSGDLILSLISGGLKDLRPMSRESRQTGQPSFHVTGEVAEVLRADRKYMTQCRTLARKFGCMILEAANGDICFVKLPEQIATRRHARSKSERSKPRKRGA